MSTRRDFLLATGAFALGPGLATRMTQAFDPAAPPAPRPSVDAAAGTAALQGVGVQLYMLRNQMRQDPERTLARIAELGFTEIEWWGEWGRTPAQLRAALQANGLRAPSAHYGLDALQPDRIGRTLETAAAMGHGTLIVASTNAAENGTLDAWKRTAGIISEAGRAGRSAGIRTSYHNHDYEFQPLAGSDRVEIFLAETDAAVVDFELDCYWAFKAGKDPVALLRRHASRITMLHLKDSAGGPAHEQRDVGAGVMDWRAILTAARAGRVTNVYVEHDNPADAWATAAAGRAHLRTLGL
jgi:sugar phosphate isomerase/epimerase